MGFSCKNKNVLTPTIPNYIDRDLGLSNIYNVNTDVSFCMENFNSPLYYMSGATKPTYEIFSACTSGNTTDLCDGLYNISEIDNFNLIFNITGGTSYTGYTGQFCYKLFSRSDFTIGIPVSGVDTPITTQLPLYENCVDFSGITSNTITELIGVTDLPTADNDYRLVDYVNFVPNECSIIEDGSGGFLTTNTWDISDNYINFDIDKDWYFVTVVNPPTPTFPNPLVDSIANSTLFSERLLLVNGQLSYALSNTPQGGVVNVYVNGITLTNTLDYSLDYSQAPTGPTIITFNNQLEYLRDYVVVTYIIGNDTNLNNQSDLFNIETVFYTGSTTGVTATTENIINYNTTSMLEEIFLQYNILVNSSPVLTINGTELTENIGFYKSNTVKNKINLHPNITLQVGDIITIWYFKESATLTNGNLGKLSSNDVNIVWNLPSSVVPTQYNPIDAYFTVEVTEEDDITYSGVTYSAITQYSGVTLYSQLFEDVTINEKYIYKVCLHKKYTTITGDDIITKACNNGSFDLTSGEVLYSSS